MFPVSYNSYPLGTSDSGAYINNRWIIRLPYDRPIGHSLFIRMASLNGVSLWGVVIVQSLLISLVLGMCLFLYALLMKNKDLLRPASALLVISIAGQIALSTLIAIAGRGFRPSSATHVFLISRMVQIRLRWILLIICYS